MIRQRRLEISWYCAFIQEPRSRFSNVFAKTSPAFKKIIAELLQPGKIYLICIFWVQLIKNVAVQQDGSILPFLLEFHEKSWVCGSPRYNMGNYKFFFWFKNLQRSIISKKSKGQKIKIIFFLRNVFFNANIILVENQILDKTSF